MRGEDLRWRVFCYDISRRAGLASGLVVHWMRCSTLVQNAMGSIPTGDDLFKLEPESHGNYCTGKVTAKILV